MSTRIEGRTHRRFISPRARRALQHKGLDAARVLGSGPNGRVIEADVLAFAQNQESEIAPAKSETAKSETAKTELANSTFTLRAELDATQILELQKRREISTRDFAQRVLSCALSTHDMKCEVVETASRRADEFRPALPLGAHGIFGLGRISPRQTLALCFVGEEAQREKLEQVFDAVCEIIEDPLLLVFR